jgi:integrase
LAADRGGGPAISVLSWCGLRFGELAALRVRDLDLDRRRLSVERSVTEVGGRLLWSDPKSHRGRSVPFPKSLAGVLQDQAEGKGAEDPLFTAPDGGVLRLNNWRRRVFDPACARIGREDITPHDLRHTAASLAIRAGANVKAVQHMLGHASAAMTLDVYAGLFRDDLDGVASALDGMLQDALQDEALRSESRSDQGDGGVVRPLRPQTPPAV